MQAKLIDAEKAVAFEQAARVGEAWHLATLWTRVLKVEMKADHLEAELACVLESHQGIGATEKKPSKGKHEPPITRKVHGSFRVVDEARLQRYNFGFRVYELIIGVTFPK